MAAVEDYEERGGGVQARYEVAVQGVAVELPLLLVVDGDDGVVEAGGAVAGGVFDLPAVAGVVQEVGGVGFADEPLWGCRALVRIGGFGKEGGKGGGGV